MISNLAVLAVAVVAVTALPRPEPAENSLFKGERNLYGLGGGHLLRDLESALRENPMVYERPSRNLDSLDGVTFGSSKRNSVDPSETKRNMDEIDRAGFDTFVKRQLYNVGLADRVARKRNFVPSHYEMYGNYNPVPFF
ncbi:uncharacterized protein LOC106669325 isoform X1 [Cimex lectularius]|uniref:Orcokinin n=1 Tax=Cimex lectularius TaxID=79782 RepID=A0A8I6S6H7_CIMLE|nr:uncharacterized protein LOC106669325 isoform X1 [Cimex lectularius]